MPVVGPHTVPPMGVFGAPRPGSSWRTHQGLDQYAPEGTPIVLLRPATITAIGYNPDPKTGAGHWISYRHDDDRHSMFEAHLVSRPLVTVGRRYPELATIGGVGRTGNAAEVGPHVHIETRTPAGTLIDPAPYLAQLMEDHMPTVEEIAAAVWRYPLKHAGQQVTEAPAGTHLTFGRRDAGEARTAARSARDEVRKLPTAQQIAAEVVKQLGTPAPGAPPAPVADIARAVADELQKRLVQ